MRFRVSGTNWEGRRWRVAHGLVDLGTQISDAWPDRHPADGTVASKTHDANNPRSDHRPWPYDGDGIVYALDAGETVEGQGARLAEELRGSRDPRIRYVIHERRIFSSYDHADGPAWKWRPYRGASEHLDHVHVSLTRGAGDAGGRFDIDLRGDDSMAVKEEVWAALREGHIGNLETDPTILDAIRRTYYMTAALYQGIAAGQEGDPAEVAALIADQLDDTLAQAVVDELRARLES